MTGLIITLGVCDGARAGDGSPAGGMLSIEETLLLPGPTRKTLPMRDTSILAAMYTNTSAVPMAAFRLSRMAVSKVDVAEAASGDKAEKTLDKAWVT